MATQTPEEKAQAAADAAALAEAEQALADANKGKVQVQFLRPLCLGDKDYPVGTHAVPVEAVTDNWFYDAHVKEGNLVEIGAADGRRRKAK